MSLQEGEDILMSHIVGTQWATSVGHSHGCLGTGKVMDFDCFHTSKEKGKFKASSLIKKAKQLMAEKEWFSF